MRIARIKARNVHAGDKLGATAARVMGGPGRKPTSASPLRKLDYEYGTTETLREDDTVEVLRP